MTPITRTEEQIDAVLNEASDGGPSKFPGMSYEQGITEFWNWLTGLTDDDPMAD